MKNLEKIYNEMVDNILGFLEQFTKWVFIVLAIVVFFVVLVIIIKAVTRISRFNKYKNKEKAD